MSDTNGARFCALVAYDGTDFAGFQRQNPPHRTVQGELEQAAGKIAGEAVTITAAGRTDAGVHASGQVVSFKLPWRHDLATLRKALNVNLPADIAVKEIAVVPDRFHPRFDARLREYRYHIRWVPDGQRQPFSVRYCWQNSRVLDLDLMNQASDLLVGQKDFATFGNPPQGENTVRTVFQAVWCADGQDLQFKIEANAFLFRMVRTLVGTLVRVGDGSWSMDRFWTALQSRRRDLAAEPAPPNGLFLHRVTYDKWPELFKETESETLK